MKISAVIFARKGSKRVKNKMHQKFFGKSLIETKIEQLFKTNVDEIIVGSDDLKVEKIVNNYIKKENKTIKFYLRKKKYCIEKCSINSAIKNMLSFFNTDLVLWAHLTNPLTNEKHYNEAIKIYKKNINRYDSLFSTSETLNYFWGLDKKPINNNPQEKTHSILSSGKIKPLYVDNGSIFLRYHKDMKKDGRFWGKKPLMYVMSEKDGWDINQPWDLEVAQLKSFYKKFK
jgi:CMP-N-acetylneuraminic acid synthetase